MVTCKVVYQQGQKKKTKKLKATVTVRNNKQIYPKHKPYGKGIGAKPGRVVWSHNPKSVSWNGKGYWWKTEHFNEKAIIKMFRNSIASLGGTKKGEKIAIKANINSSGVFDDDDSGKTKMSYTNPVLLKALLTSLVKDACVAPSDRDTAMGLPSVEKIISVRLSMEMKCGLQREQISTSFSRWMK